MFWIAIRMLIGKKAKYLGMVTGVAIASLLIAQQCAIFCGIMLQTANPIRDVWDARIWVMNPNLHFVDEVNRLPESDIYRVRSVEGVDWAVAHFKGFLMAELLDGRSYRTNVVGIDDATLIGGPQHMVTGRVTDLYQPDAVIIDEVGYHQFWPGEPLRIGRSFEICDRRAVIVGVCRASPTFQTFPVVYTRYGQAKSFLARHREPVSFILANPRTGVSAEEVCRRIEAETGLRALEQDEFLLMTMQYFLRTTAVLLNFALTVSLGFLVGLTIVGTMFHMFTLENLRQFATLKAIGASDKSLIYLIVTQGLVVGLIGYGFGIGLAAGFSEFFLRQSTHLTANMPWPILACTAFAVLLIVVVVSVVSIRRVMHLEPARVLRY